MTSLSAALAALRSEYMQAGLQEEDALADPLAQLERWLAEALAAGVYEANAMTLATVSPEGVPSARIVLVKGIDARGVTFFTNYDSDKGRAIAAHPRVALAIHWRELERQVRLEGDAAPVTREESEAYFASRPRGSQLGAWASKQSEVVASRAELDRALAEAEARFAGQVVPCPPHWGGYRVTPTVMELWQGRPNRMHDRLRYQAVDAGWRRARLAP
jgi:pyridoxamine 5'-phosphate oxidase